MPDIIHFEITTDVVAETARFYAQAFGWIAEPSPFLPEYTLLAGGSGTGAVMAKSYQKQKVIVWYAVDNIETALDAVVAAGGQRAGDINSIPGQGRVTYAADINGTIFGLKQP